MCIRDRVISEETAAEMRDIMEYVVSDGGAGGAKVTGYRVGGKTGTANKVENGKYGNNYYSSFIGMAPMDDPKLAILVVVDLSLIHIFYVRPHICTGARCPFASCGEWGICRRWRCV